MLWELFWLVFSGFLVNVVFIIIICVYSLVREVEVVLTKINFGNRGVGLGV